MTVSDLVDALSSLDQDSPVEVGTPTIGLGDLAQVCDFGDIVVLVSRYDV